MKIKITEQLISIPPHISTTWDKIIFLQTTEDFETKNLILVIHLLDGKVVQIPGLDSTLIDIVFAAHMQYLEGRGNQTVQSTEPPKSLSNLLQQLTGLSPEQLSSMPIRLGISTFPGIEGIEMAFQHNQEQANAPNMPLEILDKITSMAKMMSGGDLGAFAKAEPHCNCMHCQVCRAITGTSKLEQVQEIDESVSEEDLTFKSWEIDQLGENLFKVSHPLDPKEEYSVFLGTPVGCTCGQNHCEHIKAVLYS